MTEPLGIGRGRCIRTAGSSTALFRAPRAGGRKARGAYLEAQRQLLPTSVHSSPGVISLELAQTVAEQGDRGAAVDHVRAALATFERLGASPVIDCANALLRSLGARARSMTKPAAASVSALTEREQQAPRAPSGPPEADMRELAATVSG